MTITNLVTRRELAEEMKRLGVRGNPLYFYNEDGHLIYHEKIPEILYWKYIAAWTSGELWNALPTYISVDGKLFYLHAIRDNGDPGTSVGYYAFQETKYFACIAGDSFSFTDALAKLVIQLVESGLVLIEEINRRLA